MTIQVGMAPEDHVDDAVGHHLIWFHQANKIRRPVCAVPMEEDGLVCWSLTSLCHSNGHIETMPAREINPFSALTRIRPQFLRTQ